MKNKKIVVEILDAVGGESNIRNFEHCATRLRIILNDNNLVDQEKVKTITGCKGHFFNTGQHQFIFGTGKVNEVYADFKAMVQIENVDFKQNVYANMSVPQKAIRTLADILIPLIPVLVTTGLLMGVRGLLIELGLPIEGNTLVLFQMLTDTAFAFLPVLIAYSATKKFGGNPIIGIVVGLMMVAPQLPNAWAVASGDALPLTFSLFGLKLGIVGYQGSILPAILAGYMVSKIELNLRKVVPQIMDLVVTPFLTITITIASILFILGPITHMIETSVTGSIISLINFPLGIGYIVFGAFQQVLTITGLHHSIGIIELDLLANTGKNVIQPLTTASMAGQFGAAVGFAFLLKDKLKRANALSASSSTLFGITEPLLFGINLLDMRIFISGIIAGGVGGLLVYIFDLKASGMGITFIPGLLLYTGDFTGLIQYLIVIVAAFAIGFILIQLQRKDLNKNEQ